MSRDGGRAVGKKPVRRELGLGGLGELRNVDDRLLGGSVEREEGLRERNVVACERHDASLMVGMGKMGVVVIEALLFPLGDRLSCVNSSKQKQLEVVN